MYAIKWVKFVFPGKQLAEPRDAQCKRMGTRKRQLKEYMVVFCKTKHL